MVAVLREAEIGRCEECNSPRTLTSALDIVDKHTRRCTRRAGYDPGQLSTDPSPAPRPPPRPPTPAVPGLDDDLPDISGPPDYERKVTVLTSRQPVVTGGYDIRQVRIARYGQLWVVEVWNRGGAIRPGPHTRDEQQAKDWANDEWRALVALAQGSRYWEVARTR